MYCAFRVTGSLSFRRFGPCPLSGSALLTLSRGGAGSGAGVRFDLAACAVGFGGFWPLGSSPVLGLFGWISCFVGWGGEVSPGIRWRGYPGGSEHVILNVLWLYFVIYVFHYMLTYCYFYVNCDNNKGSVLLFCSAFVSSLLKMTPLIDLIDVLCPVHR